MASSFFDCKCGDSGTWADRSSGVVSVTGRWGVSHQHTHTCVYYLPLSVYIPKIQFLDLLSSKLLPRSLHAVQYITYITWYTILHIPLLYITIQYTFTYLWPYYVFDNPGKWGCMCGHCICTYVHVWGWYQHINKFNVLFFHRTAQDGHMREQSGLGTSKAFFSKVHRQSDCVFNTALLLHNIQWKQPLSEDLKCLSHQVCSTCERRWESMQAVPVCAWPLAHKPMVYITIDIPFIGYCFYSATLWQKDRQEPAEEIVKQVLSIPWGTAWEGGWRQRSQRKQYRHLPPLPTPPSRVHMGQMMMRKRSPLRQGKLFPSSEATLLPPPP